MLTGNRSDTAPGLRDASSWGGGAAPSGRSGPFAPAPALSRPAVENRISHPFIPHDIGEDPARGIRIASELVERENLRDRMERDRLEVKGALRFRLERLRFLWADGGEERASGPEASDPASWARPRVFGFPHTTFEQAPLEYLAIEWAADTKSSCFQRQMLLNTSRCRRPRQLPRAPDSSLVPFRPG